MPAASSKIGPPPVPQSKSTASSSLKFKNSGAVRIVENKESNQVTKPTSDTSIDVGSKFDTRMLQAKGITNTRLEILALMDFQPLFEGESRSLAGNLLNVRYGLRSIDLATTKKIISDLKTKNPDAFQNALDIYTANLESARVDTELLKTAYLMKEYGARALDYNSHLSNTILQNSDGANIGSLALDFYPVSLLIDPKSPSFAKNASVMFGQFLSDIVIFSRVGFPGAIGSKQRSLLIDAIINDPGVSTVQKTSTTLASIRIARELAASLKLGEVQSGSGDEKELHPTIKSTVGSDYFSLTVVPDQSVFERSIGIDPWQDLSVELDFDLKSRSPIKITDALNFSGLIGQIDIPDKNILLLENGSRSYNGITYTPSNALVNSAFKPSSPLNFTDYTNASRAFYTSCKNASSLLRTLYFPRFRGKTPTETSFAVGERITAASMLQASIKTFSDRFATKISSSAYPSSGKMTSGNEQIQYVKSIAHVFIRDNPSGAAKILEAFIKDYNSGKLNTSPTASAIGTSVAVASIGTAVSLVPQSSNLQSAKKYFRDWLRSRELVSNLGTATKTSTKSSPSFLSKKTDPEVLITVDGDLRSQTVILTSSTVSGNESKVSSFEDVAIFEIIDYGIDALKGLISRFATINELEEDDPVWPNPGKYVSITTNTVVEPSFPTSNQVPAPYYNQLPVATLSSRFWIPTVREFSSRFFRGSTGKTWLSGMSVANVLTGIYRVQSNLMSTNYEMLKVKRAEQPEILVAGMPKLEFAYLSVDVPEATSTASIVGGRPPGNSRYKQYFSEVPNAFIAVLASTPASYKNVTVASTNSSTLKALERIKSSITSVKEDDLRLKVAIQILDGFANRSSSFSEKAIDTFTGSSDDTNAVYELATSLVKQGNAGLDILESLNQTQITLRDISLSRQSGDRANGYVPRISIVSSREKLAIECLAASQRMRSPEGLNVRNLIVGIPAGANGNIGYENEYSVAVRIADLEYSDLTFLPKSFNFDNRLYAGPSAFDRVTTFSNFNDLVNQASFYYNDFEVQEVPGTAPKLIKKQTIRYVKSNTQKFDICSNTAVSSILELYYKTLVGIEINEDTFPSVQGSSGIPLNKYAGNLTAALASLSADLAPPNSKAAEYYKTAADITSEKNASRAVAIDGFTELDAEFVASMRNAFTTRLLSAEDMKDAVLKAKIFDRVLYLPIDPDEFVIATQANSKSSFTPGPVIDKYIRKGILLAFTENGATNYKLAPRKVADGRMAFVKMMASLEAPSNTGSLLVEK